MGRWVNAPVVSLNGWLPGPGKGDEGTTMFKTGKKLLKHLTAKCMKLICTNNPPNAADMNSKNPNAKTYAAAPTLIFGPIVTNHTVILDAGNGWYINYAQYLSALPEVLPSQQFITLHHNGKFTRGYQTEPPAFMPRFSNN